MLRSAIMCSIRLSATLIQRENNFWLLLCSRIFQHQTCGDDPDFNALIFFDLSRFQLPAIALDIHPERRSQPIHLCGLLVALRFHIRSRPIFQIHNYGATILPLNTGGPEHLGSFSVPNPSF